jgi:hypothetical protein
VASCKFCGKDAGWFKDEHQACRNLLSTGWQSMVQEASDAALGRSDPTTLRERLTRLAVRTRHTKDAISHAVVAGLEEGAKTALHDKVLSRDEETALMCYANNLNLQQGDLDRNGWWTRTAMGAVLREVLDGGLPTRIELDRPVPFNFQKDEVLVWMFQGVPYHEVRTWQSFEGGSAGVSFRVAKGVYFRTSAFRGYPVGHAQLQQIDTGLFGVTDKHLYFAGVAKSFRIPYKKIVTFTPYSDAISIVRDLASAKPQVFMTGEGWFTYNLIMNLAQR